MYRTKSTYVSVKKSLKKSSSPKDNEFANAFDDEEVSVSLSPAFDLNTKKNINNGQNKNESAHTNNKEDKEGINNQYGGI